MVSLDLLGCRGIGDLRPLASLRSLSRLRVEVKTAGDLAAVSEVRSLTDLDLIAHGDVGGLRPLAALKNLRSLQLTGFDRLSDLSPAATRSDCWTSGSVRRSPIYPRCRS